VHVPQYAREHVHHYYLDADAAIRLSNYVAFGDRCVLNIVGPSGSGKTSLLRTFLNLYEARRAARCAPPPPPPPGSLRISISDNVCVVNPVRGEDDPNTQASGLYTQPPPLEISSLDPPSPAYQPRALNLDPTTKQGVYIPSFRPRVCRRGECQGVAASIPL
jgi:energy-coupling factor transporter ATP-binding protein EcfA2